MIASRLIEYLQTNGLPVVSVSVGNPTDRTTWIVQLAPNATAEQIAALPGLVAAFNPDTNLTTQETDRRDIATAQAAQMLNQIAVRRQQITTDRAALPTATANQQRAIVDRMLNAEDTTLAALATLVRALRWLV